MTGFQPGWILLLLPVLAAAADLPAGEGREVLLRDCVGCHKAEEFVGYRHTPDEYRAIVSRMGDRAQAPAKDLEAITEYLSKNFPKTEDPSKINVNKASAGELEKGLNLTDREAKAIIAYRERHGDFHAPGDLYVIYGVDGKKIEAAKDKISF